MPRARFATALALTLATGPAAARERSEIPDTYKWNLADLYPSVEAWQAAREDLGRRVTAFGRHRGHLGDSAEALWKVASTSIARAISDESRRGKTAARDAYLRMLRAGGSKYPIELLKEAGVDMTTSAPFDAAMAEMNGTMDEMEKILARREKAKR